jgi:AraC family transcriptional regulator, arabinose operon regulatory protein
MAAPKVMLGTGERRDVGKAGADMDERIKRVLVEMDKHLDSELSLDVLAQSVNLSTSRFRHLFKAETGTTPAQYLKSLRMSRAKKLVETTFLNIKQIMCSIGVRDKRHFAKDFERTYGLTPTQYRARLRGAGRGSN